MRKKLIAFEGPAGSGKSHAIREFSTAHPGVTVLQRRPETQGKRSYDSEQLPLTVNLDYLVNAVYAPGDVFLIDRFWVNSLVYQPFRYMPPKQYGTVDQFPTAEAVWEAERNLVTAAETVLNTIKVRDWNVPPVTVLNISYHVITPSRELLNQNREHSGKDYPFDPDWETLRYIRVADYWVKPLYGLPVSITLTHHVVRSYSDYNLVQASLEKELGDWRS